MKMMRIEADAKAERISDRYAQAQAEGSRMSGDVDEAKTKVDTMIALGIFG